MSEPTIHLLEGVSEAMSVMPRVFDIVHDSEDDSDATKRLRAEFGWDEDQVRHVLHLQLRRVTRAQRRLIGYALEELRQSQ